jgi:acetylornithine aminotransferase
MDRFREVGRKVPGAIEEVRGKGLLIGIVLARPGKKVWETLLQKGFILNLTQERILRLLPPLIIEKQDLEAFASALEEVLRTEE